MILVSKSEVSLWGKEGSSHSNKLTKLISEGFSYFLALMLNIFYHNSGG